MLLRWLRSLLVIAGAACLGYAAFLTAESFVAQRYESVKFNRALAAPAPPLRAVGPQDPVGKIDIPSAGISAIVLEGDDNRTLNLGPGHIPGTALPGGAGNVGVAAHRDTFFRGLEKLHKGDNIQFETLGGVYEYTVGSTEVVNPDRTDVLASSGNPMLTLVTCYPFHFIGPAPMRFIVHARLVQKPASEKTLPERIR